MASMTPYAAAKIVNKALSDANIDKQVPPQMMYNYTTARINKGKEPMIACDSDNRITEEGLATWLHKYIAKQQQPAAAVETETETTSV